MLDDLINNISLLRASFNIKRIEKDLQKKSTEIAKVHFNHKTSLIKFALIAPIALYYSLPRKERNKAKFNEYIDMMAFGLYAGDLEDAMNDNELDFFGDNSNLNNDAKNRKSEKVRSHFLNKSEDLAKQNGLYLMYNRAKNQSREYQKTEAKLAKQLKNGDTSFVNQLFKENPNLENMTYDRIAVLYTFGVKAAFRMFLNNTSVEEYYKNIKTWSRYLPIAMQEGADDANDLKEDLARNVPTPPILRGIKHKLDLGNNIIWPLANDDDVIFYGKEDTKEQVNKYFKKIRHLDLPEVLHKITIKAREEINI
jgi:hypothetical protein